MHRKPKYPTPAEMMGKVQSLIAFAITISTPCIQTWEALICVPVQKQAAFELLKRTWPLRPNLRARPQCVELTSSRCLRCMHKWPKGQKKDLGK